MKGSEPARGFLRSEEGQRAERVVRRFHRWLDAKDLAVTSIAPADVERFLQVPFRKMVTVRTSQQYKRALMAYLLWLDDHGMLDFNPRQLGAYRRSPLPPSAETFLRSLQPTHRASTCGSYRTNLQQFHQWLEDARVRLRRLKRQHVELWLLSLSDRKLSAATRTHAIQNVSPQSLAIIQFLHQSGNRARQHLLERVDGSMVRYAELVHHLKLVCEGFETPEPITSHRLRHTYATSLLNAGMSLVSVMKLLGHRDYRMTLRYTAITQETVGQEYFDALRQLETRYAQLRTATRQDDFDPVKALDEVARWAKGAIGRDGRALVKRIRRVRDSIARRKNQPTEDG
jgi:site-specific recombinase XerD